MPQFPIPGGSSFEDSGGLFERQIPGGVFVNENAQTSGTINPDVAILGLQGYGPTIINLGFVIPGTAEFVITGFAPALVGGSPVQGEPNLAQLRMGSFTGGMAIG